jgi:hypothetical protein
LYIDIPCTGQLESLLEDAELSTGCLNFVLTGFCIGPLGRLFVQLFVIELVLHRN